MTAFPPVIRTEIGRGASRGVFGRTTDPAKLLIAPSRYVRPYLKSGALKFEWPLGVEGLRVAGQASVAEHRYLGDNALVVDVTHLDARRIEMRGLFPGMTGAENVRDLLEVIIDENPPDGKELWLPGIFPKTQFGVVESYEFTHEETDATDSWMYVMTFIRTGVGKKKASPARRPSPTNPTTTRKPKKKPKGQPAKKHTVKSAQGSVKSVAKQMYGDADRWLQVYENNREVFQGMGIPMHETPTAILPPGTSLKF